ncbi:hypothetical protein KSP40_PGU019469 [Platanthera guangdongensis]|uniref:Uncharacterized protein n=1 Tax=Platanthera guangdongensis TaxID=2320717 RepID=A0ABR2M1T0_9ASPA
MAVRIKLKNHKQQLLMYYSLFFADYRVSSGECKFLAACADILFGDLCPKTVFYTKIEINNATLSDFIFL